LDILKHTSIGITLTELCAKACKENIHIAEYLGEKLNLEHNHKLRSVIDMLLNHAKIKLVRSKPMVLQYFDEVSSDASDIYDTTVQAGQNKVTDPTSDVSDISDGILNNMMALDYVTTPEQNHKLSDISDISDATTETQLNSKQESRSIFRLGHSDTWACEKSKQRGDIHYMRGHLCRGETK
jgi:hypothetical protein